MRQVAMEPPHPRDGGSTVRVRVQKRVRWRTSIRDNDYGQGREPLQRAGLAPAGRVGLPVRLEDLARRKPSTSGLLAGVGDRAILTRRRETLGLGLLVGGPWHREQLGT